MKKIPYGKQTITEADIAAVTEALQADFLTGGPRIAAFEKAFAEYIGVTYAVAVANGTAALHLSAMALGVKEGDRVITTPMTFSASANCVKYCGGSVEFADINPETGLLDIEAVRRMLEEAPEGHYQGVIPVDYAGYPVDLEAFRELADQYDLFILEDACHAPGGYFTDSKGKQQNCGNGAYADLAIFSFHPVKHFACGEGGMVTTNRKDLYEKLMLLRNHGLDRNPDHIPDYDGGWRYDLQELGYNYRLTDIQAALGLSQLQRADVNLASRKAIAKRYDEAFAGGPVKPLGTTAGHAYHLYVILAEDRRGLYDHLRSKGIFVQVHYVPVHRLSYYKQLEETPELIPHADAHYARCLSLPMFPTLTEEDQKYVIEAIKAFYA